MTIHGIHNAINSQWLIVPTLSYNYELSTTLLNNRKKRTFMARFYGS